MDLHARRMQTALAEIRQAKQHMQAKKLSSGGQRGWFSLSTSTTGQASNNSYDPKQLSDFYSKNELIAACTKEKASAMSEGELEVVRDLPDGNTESVDHEVLNLFYNNKNYSYSQIINLMSIRYDLTGAFFAALDLYKNRLGAGDFVPVPSHLVSMKTKGPVITGFHIQTDTGSDFYGPEEVCAILDLDPSGYQTYTSALLSAIREVENDEERKAIVSELMKNKNVPGIILESENNFKREQRMDIKGSLEEQIGSTAQNRGKTIVLPHGLKLSNQNNTHDIDFSQINGLTESRICLAFGVPPIVIGAKVGLDKATYSNYEQARKSFYRETVRPLWTYFASALTKCLVHEPDLYFRFNTTKVEELKEDTDKTAGRAEKLYKAGIIDVNEAREMLGLDPIEEEIEEPVEEVVEEPMQDPVEEEDIQEQTNEDS